MNANRIKTKSLAILLGVSVSTIERWARTDAKLASCRWRRGWWTVSQLREAGFIAGVAHG